MATYSSVLAWRIPGTGEPGGLPSMGSHRVRHDWSDLAAVAAAVFSQWGTGGGTWVLRGWKPHCNTCACPPDTWPCKTVIKMSLPTAPCVSKSILWVWAVEHFSQGIALLLKDLWCGTMKITLLTEVPIVKAMVFSSSYVWMWELDHKESWVLKNWCFWTVVLEKTLESPLDCKEILHWRDWC